MCDKERLFKLLQRWPFYREMELLCCYDDHLVCPCFLSNVCEYELRVVGNIYADIFGESQITGDISVDDIRAAKVDLLDLCKQMKAEVDDYASEVLALFDIP